MHCCEQAIHFASGPTRLLGIVARPVQPAPTGVVIVVGGPQYRAGSHRQFVRLARALADAGHAVLRFDLCGMGDSEGLPRGFQDTGPDIGAAIQALQKAVPEVQAVALWGLCDAASAILLYCHGHPDARVTGLCLANPWVRSHDSLERVQLRHYYGQRLLQPDLWRKLLRGQVGTTAVGELAHKAWRALRLSPSEPAPSSYQQRMALACQSFGGRVLLLLSENDFVAKEFRQLSASDRCWQAALRNPQLRSHVLAGADHTFSGAALGAQVAELTLRHLLERLPSEQYPASLQNGSPT